jgi:hypothetical protein
VPEVPARIGELYELLTRLRFVARNDAGELNNILTARTADGTNALDHLARGDLAAAWLEAMDAASPRRREGMMRGPFPARAGQATTALNE